MIYIKVNPFKISKLCSYGNSLVYSKHHLPITAPLIQENPCPL